MANTNLPTKTWTNPRPSSTPEWMRPIIMSLEAFLARPQFLNGVALGDGTPITKNVDGVKVTPATRSWDVDAIDIMEAALASAGTSLADVYATLATMQTDLDALETAPIAGTRITDGSISTPKLAANSVTATQLAAVNIGVGKWIASTSYSAGSSGWIISADGTAEFNNVTVRGNVIAASGNVRISSTGIDLLYGSGASNRIDWSDGGGDGNKGSVFVDTSGNGWLVSTTGNVSLVPQSGNTVFVGTPSASGANLRVVGSATVDSALTVAGANVLTTANFAFFASPLGHTHSSFNGLTISSSPLFAFHNTTGSTANAVLSSFTGELMRQSSSRRFKTAISDMLDDHDTSAILGLSARTWTSRLTPEDLGGSDDPSHRFGGLIAEEAMAIDPILAVYDHEGEPEGINWPAVTVFLLEEVKRLRADLDGTTEPSR